MAIGAATWPPVLWSWFSSITVTAIRGLSAGAKHTNQAVLMPSTPVSAVPVLPATRTPGICAFVPVPPVTTDSIIVVSSLAVWDEIACPSSFGFVVRSTPPPGLRILSTTYGCMTTPPLAIAAPTMAICSGVTWSRSWPNASRPGSTW